ncbi:MAG: acyl-CoA dehydrogenase, partial [Acidimicrobiia bacterium]|nr:acyl-CoA dehydrogenase [Acidimicrobiia bacterium]
HASPTCVVSFGDAGNGAVGFLLGEEQKGMRNMFTMMNGARIGVGLEGLAITERAFQLANAYAHERIQGRKTGSDSSDDVPIVEHPDVRRMLLTMKSYGQAMRALLYLTAAESDFADHAEDADRRKLAADRVAVFTPIVKAWCTDVGVAMASLGLQVHGGMGYVEETGAAQHYRDSRIAPIYEGTNGIQAIDLLTRKLTIDNGEVVAGLIATMSDVLGEMERFPELEHFRTELASAVDGLEETSKWLLERLEAGTIDDALAGATPYLEQFGTVLGGWLMARSAVAALNTGQQSDFTRDKVITARFYGEHLLPRAAGLLATVTGGSTLMDQAVL